MNHRTPSPTPQPLCTAFEPLLPLLSQDRLDADEAVTTREHVATCTWCQGRLRDFDFLRDALRRLEGRDGVAGDLPTYRPLTREDIVLASSIQTTTLAPAPPRELPRSQRVLGHFTPLAAVAAVLLITLLAGALFVRFGRYSGPPVPAATATQAQPSPTATLLSAGVITAVIPGMGTVSPWSQPPPDAEMGRNTYGIAVSDTAVWVLNGDTGTLLRIDPRSNTIVARIRVGHGPGGVALGQGAVWVTAPNDSKIFRIDPKTNRIVATITDTLQNTSPAGQAIAIGPTAVWVTDFAEDALIRIDPQTNAVVTTISNQRGPTGIAYGAGSVWSCNRLGSLQGLVRLDPQTNQVQAQIQVGDPHGTGCDSVVATGRTIWTMSYTSDGPNSTVLNRVDPATNTVIATIPLSMVAPYHFAADAQGVWVFDPQRVLFRIDPQANQVAGKLPLPGIAGVAVGAGSVWVAVGSTGTLLRIAPAP